MLLLGSSTAVDAAANVTATSTPHPVAAAAVANGSWTVYHHDNGHTGYDSTGAAATGATTGWVSTALDGSIYAEPLVFNGIVYAVTLQGTVYAIDQSTGVVAWSNHVGTPTSWSNQCGNINPLGISGTPVIDTAAGRIYVAENLSADHLWHVFGVDLSTHLTVMNTPIPLSLGTGIDWTIEQERGALGLANGNVYVPFGGRAGDCGAYHGWIYAVPTSGAAVTNYYETPGQGAGFWTAGGVVVDSSTGKLFETSGNGTASGCNANPNGTPAFENDAVVRFSATLAHEDSFIPLDWKANWCDNDEDLGSASMVLISPTLAFQAGKWGNGFLVNPQQLGGMNGQVYPSPTNYTGVDVCRGAHSGANYGSYAYAAPYVYLSCESQGLVALQINTTTKSFSACGATCASPNWNATGFTPGSPIVAGGAVWAVDTGGGGLYGFNASTGAQIYHSSGFGVTHFTTPSEAGGQIFVGSGNVIRSFNMTTTACTAVTDSAAPSSPQASGTGVTFTALASGCPHPLYQFWILPPGSSTWQIKQPYSAMTTFNWSTTGLPAGNYLYTVWARDSSSSGTSCSYLGCNDAFFPAPTYSLTGTVCTSVSDSAAPSSPQASGTGVTFSALASGCPHPLYQFWILPPGSSTWQIKQPYSAMTTFNWTTTGLPAGNYLYTVWARDSGSSGTNCSYLGCNDAFFPAPTYSLTGTACTSVSDAAAPSSPQGSGTGVTFTANASGCPHPLYQFWILPPGSSTWQIKQPYSGIATFNWDTTGMPAGSYLYTVWARDSSSSGTSCSYLGCNDAFFPAPSYSLTTTPCTSVTDSASPSSPQASGTAITFTALASGCSHPLYQFWILPPGSSTWQIVGPYSTTATFHWITTGLPAGRYLYTVWARDSGSTGTSCSYLGCNDAFFPGTAYTLN